MCYPRPKMQPCWTRSLAAQHELKCFFWLGCCFTFFVFLLVSVLKRRLGTQVSRFHLWTGEGFPCPPRWCNLNWDVFPLNCCGLVVIYLDLASPPPMKRHCVEPQLGGAGKRVRGSRTVSCRCVSRIPSCLQRLCRTRWREVKSTGSRSRGGFHSSSHILEGPQDLHLLKPDMFYYEVCCEDPGDNRWKPLDTIPNMVTLHACWLLG